MPSCLTRSWMCFRYIFKMSYRSYSRNWRKEDEKNSGLFFPKVLASQLSVQIEVAKISSRIESGAIMYTMENGSVRWKRVRKHRTKREFSPFSHTPLPFPLFLSSFTLAVRSFAPLLCLSLSLSHIFYHRFSRKSLSPLVSRVDRVHEGGKSILGGVLS